MLVIMIMNRTWTSHLRKRKFKLKVLSTITVTINPNKKFKKTSYPPYMEMRIKKLQKRWIKMLS